MKNTNKKHNALAELVNRLAQIRHKTKVPEDGAYVDLARLIVEELANVKDIKEFGVAHVREDMAIDAVEKCRAIAEEGVR